MTDTTARKTDAPPAGPWALTLSQWWCVINGVRATAARTNLALLSAGVAFYALMSLIPGVAALVSLFGLIGDPNWVGDQIRAVGGVAPDAVVSIIHTQVMSLLAADEGALLAGSLFNLVLSLWSALQGTRVLLMALTLVNRRAEPRTMVRRYVQAGMFTLAGIGVAILSVLIMGVAPLLLSLMHFQSGDEFMLLLLRWPVLGGGAIITALLLYRYGPRRRAPPWRWLWPGGIGAPLVWVFASSLFTFALREFPGFGAAYGSLASVVALLLWLYLTAFIFLLGGALNAEMEFFAAGKPTTPVTKEETIEPQTGVDGDKKKVTR